MLHPFCTRRACPQPVSSSLLISCAPSGFCLSWWAHHLPSSYLPNKGSARKYITMCSVIYSCHPDFPRNTSVSCDAAPWLTLCLSVCLFVELISSVPRLDLNSWYSSLSLPNAGVTGVHQHAYLGLCPWKAGWGHLSVWVSRRNPPQQSRQVESIGFNETTFSPSSGIWIWALTKCSVLFQLMNREPCWSFLSVPQKTGSLVAISDWSLLENARLSDPMITCITFSLLFKVVLSAFPIIISLG